MAIVTIPPEVHPAFNEIEVTDNLLTSVTVQEVEPLNRNITLNRVQYKGEARFNLRDFISSLFYDQRIGKPTKQGQNGWVYNDYNLFVRYRIRAYEFIALNAVRRKGEPIDLINGGEDAFLTRRERIPDPNGTIIKIPVYKGYPVGVSAMFKTMYNPDYSQAVTITFNAQANTQYNFPLDVIGPTGRFEIIDWGEGDIVSGYNLPKTHIYSTSGIKTISWFPNGAYSLNWMQTLSTTRSRLISVINLPNFSNSNMQFANCEGLTTFTASFPAGVSLISTSTGMFQRCTALTTVGENIFSNMANMEFPLWIYTFQGCTALTSLPSNLLAPIRNNIRSLQYWFMDCSRLTVSSDFIGEAPAITTISSIFSNCTSIVTAPALSGLINCTNSSYAFQGCSRMTSYPSGMNQMRSLVQINGMFSSCTVLPAIPSTNTLFHTNLRTQVTNVIGLFTGCKNITSIPTWFNEFWQNITEAGLMFENSGLTSLPNYLFPNAVGKLRSIYGIWSGCPITYFPPTILSNHGANITSALGLFMNITTAISIPSSILDTLTNITSLDNMFSGSTIPCPNGIFKNQTAVTSVVSCFANYRGGNLPNDIFENCPNITNASYFADSGSQWNSNTATNWDSLPTDLFKNCKNIVSIAYGFRNNRNLTGLTPTTPSGARLWERGIINTEYYPTQGEKCFENDTQLTEYINGDIPSLWGR